MEVPDWRTVPRMLRDLADGHPCDIVVTEGTEGPVRLSLAGLRSRAGDVARGLIALGVRPGDRVAVWGPNDVDWVVGAFGVWDAGAVLVPLSSRFKGVEAAEVLRSTGTSVLITGHGHDGVVLAGLLGGAAGGPAPGRPFAGLPDLRHVIVPQGVDHPGASRPAQLLAASSRVGRAEAEERALAVRPDDLCEIISTSGTTGTPKGVMLEHSPVLRAYWDWAEIVTLGPGDRYPVIAPFAHGFGLNAGLLASVMRRATMTPVRVFDAESLAGLIRDRGVTVLAGPPTLFHRLLEEAELDGHALRVAICGAASVPPELVRRLTDRLGLERVINAYGLMEGTVVSMTRAGDPVEVIASSAGRPVPGMEVRIVGEDGRDLPAGERGEILVRGYGVMRGYWGEPGRTAEVIRDGWLHTGDIGTLGPRGDLSIVDRKKELFITGGFNVSPAEVEGLLLREGSLAQVAVVGVPDPRLGEVGWAFVVPRRGTAADPDAIIAWARATMSNYKVPRRVIVVDALPVNANGKIDKRALRARTPAG
ncbi:acyl-CoA synthetase (AMP-forming)/AMP-acid ligase II [Streptosporangium becharense]|uniref:Acyl-CoA synthetase (AMP-forming)/AMP-acid ligase II n=1 Tax=Streptosporangium becharense TaxID=1816182 RepID=A0A7W9IDP5_9ACTN|nr:AMP-binding protein [Streptosporangium becharense]MBB2912292.1 acyl-CoA synthetase (AMP-forming)/AMP-acid ligase II [Streptosporangium becharense]MBB5818839.1 acyl-CoA synthetase (AMP-forming)/AMP-acid ligase II [Streptosporangium becharense]